MNKSRIYIKLRKVLSRNIQGIMLAVLVIVLALGVTCNFNLQKSSVAEAEPESPKVFYNNEKLRGTIFDRNGIKLSYTYFEETDEDEYNYYRAFNKNYPYCFSNIIDGFAMENGLDTIFEDMLRETNVSDTMNGIDSIGQSIQITMDAELQQQIYSLLNWNELNMNYSIEGSVVVMQPDGAVLAMVSSPSFNLQEYRKQSETRILLTGTPDISNQALSDSITNFSIFDTFLMAEYGKTDLKEIHHISEIETLLFEYFRFKSNRTISSDFTVLENTITFDSDSLSVTEMETSPLYLAMLPNTYVFGQMYSPYVLFAEVDTNVDNNQNSDEGAVDIEEKDIIDDKAESEAITEEIPENKQESLRKAFVGLTQDFSFSIKDGYTLYGDYYDANGQYGIYAVLYKNEKPEESVAVTFCIKDTGYDGIDSMNDMAEKFQEILNAVLDCG